MTSYLRDVMDHFSRFGSVSTATMFAASLLVLVCGMIWSFHTSENISYDVYNFYHQAEAFKSGLRPYSDFPLEFPPASMYVFLIPSAFTSDYDTYRALFSILVAACSVSAAYVIVKICEKHGCGPKSPLLFFTVFIVLFFSANYFIKFDIVPTLLSVLGICLYDRGMKKTACGLLVLGALIKVFPALILVLIVIKEVSDRRDSPSSLAHGLASLLAVVAAVCTAVVLPYLAIGVPFSDLTAFVGAQTGRGFQTESLMGSASILLGGLGLFDYTVLESMGTFDVVSAVSDVLVPVWGAVMAAVMIAVFAYVASVLRGGAEFSDIAGLTVVVLTAFMLVNYVFSTQYLIWLFPFVSLLYVSCGRGGDRSSITMINVLFAAAICLSTIALGLSFDSTFGAVMILRDVLLIAVAVHAFKNEILIRNGKGNIIES